MYIQVIGQTLLQSSFIIVRYVVQDLFGFGASDILKRPAAENLKSSCIIYLKICSSDLKKMTREYIYFFPIQILLENKGIKTIQRKEFQMMKTF